MTTNITKNKAKKLPVRKRTVAIKLNPQTNTFASISLIIKEVAKAGYIIEEGEFKFLLATAIQTIHGDIANEPEVLSFKPIDPYYYTAIIRFKTIHHTRIVTSLLLFGQWKDSECRFEVNKLAQTPCFLTI